MIVKLTELEEVFKTKQSVFDYVANHLLTQKRPSHSSKFIYSTACAYRGDNNTACAVGCLIPEELYQPIFEGCSVEELLTGLAPGKYLGVSPKWVKFAVKHRQLLEELQIAHDCYFNDNETLTIQLEQVAVRFGLDWRLKNGR